MCSQPMVTNQVGAMCTLMKYMLARCNSNMHVNASMMVSRVGFVKCLCNLRALVSALDMTIIVVDFVR